MSARLGPTGVPYACARMTRGLRIILDYRPALRERTGVGEYVHEMARALAVVAARTGGDRIAAFSSSWKDRLCGSDLPGVEPIDVRVPVRVLNFAWHRLGWPPVERFAGAVDVAHSAHPLLMPARAPLQVVTIHDLDFLEHPERTSREIRRDYPSLARSHARRAGLVVVSSSHTAELVERTFSVDRERIVLCPAGAPRWHPRPHAPSDAYFLFLGTIEPRKNVGKLLDGYERLLAERRGCPPLKLAGRALPESAEWLARLERPPLAGRVTYLGYIQPEQKRDLYAGAVALLIPSLHEGFGLTALEAMTLGVPVIASREGALPELLGDAALYVDPNDERSIAGAMERVTTEPALAAALGTAGVSAARRFSWESSAERLLEAYRHALQKGRT